MTHDLDSKITSYIEHFRNQVKRLREYEFHKEDRVLKKNILVSILDAISRTTSNYADGNRERFTGIVANFGNWPDHIRISAPHLSYLLENLRAPAYKNARQFIADVIAKNTGGSFVPLSRDPELEEVRKLWPVPPEQKLVGQLSLASFTHLNLLYQYRNSLVHELREPGYGIEFSDDREEPFYHGMTTVGDDGSQKQTLELVYPLNFYFLLTETVIKNVDKYLREDRIDPYGSYQFGSSWIGELNR